MVMSEERLKILQMLQDGKITAEQAEGLLEALGEDDKETTTFRQEKGSTFNSAPRGKRFPRGLQVLFLK